jgi:hypothetical protein
MTKRIYLHVGTPKSGTTYLQSILRGNKDQLEQHGVLVAGKSHVEVVNAGLVIREDPRAEELLDAHERGAWERIAREIREWSGPVAILSYELLGAATTKQARRAIADLGGAEVHVVITARDFARAVSSAWQEQLKFALRVPLENVAPKPRAEFGWLTLDPRGQANRWGGELPPERVHIVTVPRRGAAPDELWRRFAAACDIDVPGLDLSDPTPNESLGAPAAELLRRVNGHLEEPFTNNREHARWLRDVLAHQVLVPLGGESLGITDEQYERWSRRSAEAIEALREAGYDVQGDLEDLRASRPVGRSPSEVPDSELLDTAVRAIVSLLGLVREQTMIATGEDPAGRSRPRAFARKVLRRATRPVADRELERMSRRIEELEAQVQASRSLHQRVAELDDIVTSLLLPSGRGGNKAIREAINKYRKESV